MNNDYSTIDAQDETSKLAQVSSTELAPVADKFSYDVQLFSDLHKDAYGFRPRTHEFYDATPARKQEIWNQALAALKASMDEEKQRKDAAVKEFEGEINGYMQKYEADRATAIRWILQARPHDVDMAGIDGSFMCYLMGLPYEYAPELTAALMTKINQ